MKKAMRNIVEINEDLCNGCGQCILDCAEGAIVLVDGKAKVIADMYCDGLGACLGGCPTGALKIIQREADAYDEEAVEQHLAKQGRSLKHDAGHHHHGGHHHNGHGHGGHHSHHPHRQLSTEGVPGCGCSHSAPQELAAAKFCGCPGSQAQSLGSPVSPAQGANATPLGMASGPVFPPMANTHWPLKLRLMVPNAPFLQGADIVLAADCAAFAAASFHQKLRPGKVVLIACPKFEGTQVLAEHLAEIFRVAKPKSCTVARMEVPCCQGLMNACLSAKELSSSPLPIKEVIVTRQGEIVEK